ncbi:MAG: hypothetical protein C0168_06865 [Candidatus Aminicenantes bacterium]|nr:MAG: hypothetical protein C0168_06865 [Candidatus Aminicenantes bacterium]
MDYKSISKASSFYAYSLLWIARELDNNEYGCGFIIRWKYPTYIPNKKNKPVNSALDIKLIFEAERIDL